MRDRSVIHQIVAHNDSRAFTLAEAQALFPLVRAITHAAYATLEPVRRHLEGMIPSNPQIHEVEKQYETIVKNWVAKMERLVIEPEKTPTATFLRIQAGYTEGSAGLSGIGGFVSA